jgi:hypothetical protein
MARRKRMYEVRESPIHGRGLFSTTGIEPDTVLGVCRARPAGREDSPYVLWLGKQPVEVLCDLRFINHSPRPNVVYYDDLSVVALRTIRPGEELTHNYRQ